MCFACKSLYKFIGKECDFMNSLWLNSVKHFNGSNILKENLETDICIIGAGVFGTTCAYYLLKLGFSVILVDKGDLGHGTTGFSTGKITSQHGLFYDYLINSFGIDFAYDYLCANEGSIESIKKIIDEENIKCDFEYKNNFVYSLNKSDLKLFEDEKSALDKLNFKCDLVSKTSLPFDVGCALCFKNQAQFNPIKYVDSLYNCILNNNGLIFSNTVITDVKQDGEFFYSLSLNNMIMILMVFWKMRSKNITLILLFYLNGLATIVFLLIKFHMLALIRLLLLICLLVLVLKSGAFLLLIFLLILLLIKFVVNRTSLNIYLILLV